MKPKLPILCAALLSAVLPSCISLTAEIGLPNNGTPGALSGRIGGTWSWPQAQPEPALPAVPVAVGKNPVLPPP